MKLSNKEWKCLALSILDSTGVSQTADELKERDLPYDVLGPVHVLDLNNLKKLIQAVTGAAHVSVDSVGEELSININGRCLSHIVPPLTER